jgi:hypothetical protein
MIPPATEGRGRGVAAGLIAGIVGIGCCVGPAVAGLVGITSATVAIDTANTLYEEWGWAFKLAGLSSGAVAVGLAFRARRRCGSRRLGFIRYSLIVTVTGVLTYATLYGLTTWLGTLADEKPSGGLEPASTRTIGE